MGNMVRHVVDDGLRQIVLRLARSHHRLLNDLVLMRELLENLSLGLLFTYAGCCCWTYAPSC